MESSPHTQSPSVLTTTVQTPPRFYLPTTYYLPTYYILAAIYSMSRNHNNNCSTSPLKKIWLKCGEYL